MQIQKIQPYNPNFGYNPIVNTRLMNELSGVKKNKACYEYIKNLCQITNQTEKKLREADFKGMPMLTDRIARVFIPIKIVLTDMIDELFPHLNYKENELESYTQELYERKLDKEFALYSDELMENNDPDERDFHWLTKLVSMLCIDPKEEIVNKMLPVAEDMKDLTQEEAEDKIADVLQQMFPNAEIVRANELKEMYADEEEEAVEEVKNSLEESIKLGKQKVVEYIPTEKAKMGFAGLGGMRELKIELQDKVVDFLKDPVQAKLDAVDYGTKLPKGIILYGPPGCGKTTVVEHLSCEAGVPLLKLETGSLKTSQYHMTSHNIDAAFDYAESIATPEKPVLMMIDDGESFFVARNNKTEQFEAEELTTFLNRIQRAPEHNVMIAVTTNKYDIMDPAIRSRFDTQIYVGLPDNEARISLLKLFLNQNKKGTSLAKDEAALKRLSAKMEGFPIRAMEDITKEAGEIPKREAKEARKAGKIIRRDISEADFERVLSKTENQNKKIKEQNYKTNETRPKIGFGYTK